jgi:2'-5' RNA ligase
MQNKARIIINIDKSTQSHIAGKIRNLTETVEAGWVKPENFCLELATIGAIDDENLFEICEVLKEALTEIPVFDLKFDEIAWGPSNNKPKMFWLKGPQNEELIELRNIVEEIVNENVKEFKNFSPHITLAKVPKKSFSKEIDLRKIQMNVVISVDGIDVVEDVKEKKDRSFRVLQNIPLCF